MDYCTICSVGGNSESIEINREETSRVYATVPLDNGRNKLRSSETVTDELRLWSVVSTQRYSVTVCKHEQELYVSDGMLIF